MRSLQHAGVAAWLALAPIWFIGPAMAGPAPAVAAAAAPSASGLAVAVVDKRAAQIVVYRPDGSVAGRSPVLLGRDLGDHALPGVGERAQRGQLRSNDRTTPSGRYLSEPGRNRDGEAIVWLDYDKALAIHRLRPGQAHRARAQRLASASARDRRVSDGCVVVPEAFFDSVIAPLLGRSRGVVVVLPEEPGSPDPRHPFADAGL